MSTVTPLRGQIHDKRVFYHADRRYGLPTLYAVEGRCLRPNHTDTISPSCSIVCMFQAGEKIDVGLMLTNLSPILFKLNANTSMVAMRDIVREVLYADTENVPPTIWTQTLQRHLRVGEWLKRHPHSDLVVPHQVIMHFLEA